MRILVVGAGLSGAVYARILAEAGHAVSVIEKRAHIAGNCFDELHSSGVRVHRYGPHLFHTSNQQVVDWLSRFTEWTPYQHRVVVQTADGRPLPMPINLDTINGFFGLNLENKEQVESLLLKISEKIEPVVSAEDYLFNVIGKELTQTFFAPYTRKMWGLGLAEMDASVVRRLQIRYDREDRYFPNDSFQGLPKFGYTEMFKNIFNHSSIEVVLEQNFEKSFLVEYDYCFNAMPIDEFFDYEFGELPYRSIKFHNQARHFSEAPRDVTVNYCDDGNFTRETWWHNIPGHRVLTSDTVVVTFEEPCDYRNNKMERYYPVKTHDGRHQNTFKMYKELAERHGGIEFIGRCGTYQYLDMHQVVNQSLVGASKWLLRHGVR